MKNYKCFICHKPFNTHEEQRAHQDSAHTRREYLQEKLRRADNPHCGSKDPAIAARCRAELAQLESRDHEIINAAAAKLVVQIKDQPKHVVLDAEALVEVLEEQESLLLTETLARMSDEVQIFPGSAIYFLKQTSLKVRIEKPSNQGRLYEPKPDQLSTDQLLTEAEAWVQEGTSNELESERYHQVMEELDWRRLYADFAPELRPRWEQLDLLTSQPYDTLY